MNRVVAVVVAALTLLVAGAPAAAFTSRYEVQHAGSYTRTVNQSLGTSVENYADGSVTLGFATTPSPALSIVATRTGPNVPSFFVEDDYDYSVTFVPLTAAAQMLFATVGQQANHIHIATATGIATVAETSAFGSRVSSSVSAGGSEAYFDCENGGGAQCGTTHYRLALFVDHAGNDPYRCTPAGCPTVAAGTGITFEVSFDAIFSLYADATHAALTIDPTIALDPGFLDAAGLTASDFGIVPEAGFGNTAAPGVPEPASWALMITGFGVVGGMLRRTRIAVA